MAEPRSRVCREGKRGRGRVDTVLGDVSIEKVTSPGDCLDQAVLVVGKCVAQLADALHERIVRYNDVVPDGLLAVAGHGGGCCGSLAPSAAGTGRQGACSDRAPDRGTEGMRQPGYVLTDLRIANDPALPWKFRSTHTSDPAARGGREP